MMMQAYTRARASGFWRARASQLCHCRGSLLGMSAMAMRLAGFVPGPPEAVSAILAVAVFGVAARAFGAVPAELWAAVRPRVSG